MHSLNKHIYAVHVTVLLCVFSHDNEEKMPVKQITNWIAFGEIQTATTTFIACLTRFRLISYLFENLHGIPTGPWGFITVPIPIPYPQQPCRIMLAVADGPGRHAASRASCCTQRWTLSVINWPSSSVDRRKYCQLSLTDTERATLSNKDRRSTSRGYFFADKVSEGSTLSFGDTRVFLEHSI